MEAVGARQEAVVAEGVEEPAVVWDRRARGLGVEGVEAASPGRVNARQEEGLRRPLRRCCELAPFLLAMCCVATWVYRFQPKPMGGYTRTRVRTVWSDMAALAWHFNMTRTEHQGSETELV